jgi:hypothetical protein
MIITWSGLLVSNGVVLRALVGAHAAFRRYNALAFALPCNKAFLIIISYTGLYYVSSTMAADALCYRARPRPLCVGGMAQNDCRCSGVAGREPLGGTRIALPFKPAWNLRHIFTSS